ncbi:MFS transporter [Blastopirellula marina]|uniref:MFS transporter n=1 Tax=Blastopirellula marina TaxID=124 RepID=A0A2S8GCK4_9BACT|nr:MULTISPECIES: multidrug effflux MFS transporter [Pirellulaceae]PQO41814.1 MFS transporter [Blastopirellula marina]RCS56366.1 MFS transporter [Bremerella cremea]
MASRQIHPWLIAPILGILGAVGPLAIDLYLPGMPQITSELGISEGVVQFSLMTFLAGLMMGQLFYGPLSDRVGRKPMIVGGLLLFIVASLGCAFVQNGEQLLALRFVQGLGGAIGRVAGMAVVRDLYTGPTAAKLVAMMMLVLGLAPILGPLMGSAILMFASWRWIFVFLALFGVGCIVLVMTLMPETRLPHQRTSSHPIAALKNYGSLLVSRQYMPYVATMAFAQAGIYAYLTGSSFAFINIHGISPTLFSCIFASNAVGLMIGAQSGTRLLGRFSAETIIRRALATYILAAVTLLSLELAGEMNVVLLPVLLFVIITSIGFVLPLCGVMALESQGKISGTAAALMGACQFGFGTIAALVIGLTANGTAIPMAVTIALAAIAAGITANWAFPKPEPSEELCLGEKSV